MSRSSPLSNNATAFFGLLWGMTTGFVILKLIGEIEWSWVVSPFWIPVVGIAAAVAVAIPILYAVDLANFARKRFAYWLAVKRKEGR